jgi:hypothetical protein
VLLSSNAQSHSALSDYYQEWGNAVGCMSSILLQAYSTALMRLF